MIRKHGIKFCSVMVAVIFILMYVLPIDAEARFGGSRSFGSRGSRSLFSPSRSYSSTPSRSYDSSSSRSYTGGLSQQPRRGGFLRGLAGGLAGGFLGAMLFRSLGFGSPGGGIGIMDILFIGLLLYGLFWFMKRRRGARMAPVGAQFYRGDTSSTFYQPSGSEFSVSKGGNVSSGLAHIRQMDSSFNEAKFNEQTMDFFFKLQAGWANRDITGIRNLLTEEVYQTIQSDAEQLKQKKRINRLDNIAVRSVDIIEAWQENGADFITVKFLANLLDYTVDETNGDIVGGSKNEPVRFEEYWTFTRPVGNNPWRLSAVNQA